MKKKEQEIRRNSIKTRTRNFKRRLDGDKISVISKLDQLIDKTFLKLKTSFSLHKKFWIQLHLDMFFFLNDAIIWKNIEAFIGKNSKLSNTSVMCVFSMFKKRSQMNVFRAVKLIGGNQLAFVLQMKFHFQNKNMKFPIESFSILCNFWQIKKKFWK